MTASRTARPHLRLGDDRSDVALAHAVELMGAVRAEDPDDIARVLDAADLPALAVVLAAMVDDERTPRQLLDWMPYVASQPQDAYARTIRQMLAPLPSGPTPVAECGTHAAFNRHRARGQVPCAACLVAERTYQRERVRDRRKRVAA